MEEVGSIMPLPLATTTVDIYGRADTNTDYEVPYSPAVSERPYLKLSNVRAVITPYGGDETLSAGSEQSIVRFRFNCDTCDIGHLDIVVDNTTKEQYEVMWVAKVQGLGLDYMKGIISQSIGTQYINA